MSVVGHVGPLTVNLKCSGCKKKFSAKPEILSVLRPRFHPKGLVNVALMVTVESVEWVGRPQEEKSYCQNCAPIIRDLLEEKLEFFK